MAYHSWQNKAPSKEYERGHAATFGAKADRHCPTCGRLPAWCECPRSCKECGHRVHAGFKCSSFVHSGEGFDRKIRLCGHDCRDESIEDLRALVDRIRIARPTVVVDEATRMLDENADALEAMRKEGP